ncbi:MFS general substrate transporter [Thozetella sp. PMI_491]|nr:MFS general substrate transporter [Thozetella sp. PMI_491]
MGEICQVLTHRSMGHETPIRVPSSREDPFDEIYDKLPIRRKQIILALLSFCSFLTPISSTSFLSAGPEVAEEYHTTVAIINLANAMYMLFMGLSPLIWGPLSQCFGRRWVTLMTAIAFLGCSIGTALAPNLEAFFVFRILTALEGTSFLLVGSAVIGDIFRPTERATALGWFLSGTLIGPALGPFFGGIIVTYTSWRVIFWLQTGMAGVAAVGAFFLLPETIHRKGLEDMRGLNRREQIRFLLRRLNPWRVLQLYAYPNVCLTAISSSSLLWNMYQIFAAIRTVLNPRFHLTTPLQSGLFFLAPGAGYFVGTFLGGRYADMVVKKYIKKRGIRIPEDRLYSCLPFLIFIAVCIAVYGWTMEYDRGGIPLAVILLFLQGVAQFFCFPSLNTYCLDIMPERSGEVIAANFAVRYLFACAATGSVVPGIEVIGVGWFSTITAAFLAFGSLGVLITIKKGKEWREKIETKRGARDAKNHVIGSSRAYNPRGNRSEKV